MPEFTAQVTTRKNGGKYSTYHITLPKKLRELLGIEVGNLVTFSVRSRIAKNGQMISYTEKDFATEWRE